jgi:hypothetical protein
VFFTSFVVLVYGILWYLNPLLVATGCEILASIPLLLSDKRNVYFDMLPFLISKRFKLPPYLPFPFEFSSSEILSFLSEKGEI